MFANSLEESIKTAKQISILLANELSFLYNRAFANIDEVVFVIRQVGMSRNFFLSGVILSLGLFLGRISGFFREIVIAHQFGASKQSDLIVVILTTPDLIVSLLMGGAMSMALIPEFKSLSSSNAEKLYKQTTTLLMFIGCLLCLLLFFFKENILSLLILNNNSENLLNDSFPFILSLLSLPFSLAAGASLAYLNSQEKFLIPSLGTLIVNVTVILFLVTSIYVATPIYYIAIGVVVSATLRWMAQVLQCGIVPICIFSKTSSLISSSLIKRYTHALLTGGIIFALPLVVRTAASSEGEGVLSLVNYSLKLVELPLVVMVAVFSSIFIPILSEKYNDQNNEEFNKTSSLVFFWVLTISTILTLPIYLFPSVFVKLVYGWGSLSNENITMISNFLRVMIISLPFQGINNILITIYSSRKDTKLPFYFSTVLGGGLYAFIIAFQPSIDLLLWSVIIFYAFLSIALTLFLAIHHNINIFKYESYDRFILLGAIALLNIFLASHFTNQIHEMNIFFSSSVLGIHSLLSLFFIYHIFGRGKSIE